MHRRLFLKQSSLGAAGCALATPARPRHTEHLIFIVNGGGARKKDYYENDSLCPNIRKIASEGFVFEEDHCERIASHNAAFRELLTGQEWLDDGPAAYPNIFDYLNARFQIVRSIRSVPAVMRTYKPRIIVCRKTDHDVGHRSYEEYLRVIRATDLEVGKVFDWVKNHAYFGRNTAIVIRPEFGRDDEVNHSGQLHHSEGFYCTHRVASIFWGPDFVTGVDRTTVISRLDMAPTLASLFGVKALYAEGRVMPGLFKTEHRETLP